MVQQHDAGVLAERSAKRCADLDDLPRLDARRNGVWLWRADGTGHRICGPDRISFRFAGNNARLRPQDDGILRLSGGASMICVDPTRHSCKDVPDAAGDEVSAHARHARSLEARFSP